MSGTNSQLHMEYYSKKVQQRWDRKGVMNIIIVHFPFFFDNMKIIFPKKIKKYVYIQMKLT